MGSARTSEPKGWNEWISCAAPDSGAGDRLHGPAALAGLYGSVRFHLGRTKDTPLEE